MIFKLKSVHSLENENSQCSWLVKHIHDCVYWIMISFICFVLFRFSFHYLLCLLRHLCHAIRWTKHETKSTKRVESLFTKLIEHSIVLAFFHCLYLVFENRKTFWVAFPFKKCSNTNMTDFHWTSHKKMRFELEICIQNTHLTTPFFG